MATLNGSSATVQTPPAALAQPEVLTNAHYDPRDTLRSAPKVKIKVHKTGLPNERDVYVGVNGVGFQIQRGEEVDVPVPVMKVLENAVQTVHQWKKAPDGSLLEVKTEVQAYPFTRLH